MTNLELKLRTRKRKRVINVKECKHDLHSILFRFFKAFNKAVKKYEKEIVQTRPSARCRGYEASLLNSKMIESMQDEFNDEWSFGKYKRFLININGYLFFIKKLDNKGYPMNIKTNNSSYIFNQEQGELFDVTDDGSEPVLFFGYQKNKFGEIVNPQLVYIDDNKIRFTITEKDIREEDVHIVDNKQKVSAYLRGDQQRKAE